MPRHDWFAALVERILPWYEPARERMRDRHTEAIRLRSIEVRKRAEQVIDDYRDADRAARHGR